MGYLALCLYELIITHLSFNVYYIMHIILVVHGGIFQNPFSERYAFAFKVVCVDHPTE